MFPPETRILVVNSLKSMRDLIIASCKSRGFDNFIEAGTAEKALQFFTDDDPPELVICDYELQDMDGVELYESSQKLMKGDPIPFIFVTVEAKRERVLRAIKAGVSDYLLKPFTPEKLHRKLEETHLKVQKS